MKNSTTGLQQPPLTTLLRIAFPCVEHVSVERGVLKITTSGEVGTEFMEALAEILNLADQLSRVRAVQANGLAPWTAEQIKDWCGQRTE